MHQPNHEWKEQHQENSHSILLSSFRRVSTTLRHMLTEFNEFFHVSWTGLLIQASNGDDRRSWDGSPEFTAKLHCYCSFAMK